MNSEKQSDIENLLRQEKITKYKLKKIQAEIYTVTNDKELKELNYKYLNKCFYISSNDFELYYMVTGLENFFSAKGILITSHKSGNDVSITFDHAIAFEILDTEIYSGTFKDFFGKCFAKSHGIISKQIKGKYPTTT